MKDQIAFAQELHNKGKIQLALQEYLNILGKTPQDALAYQGLAQCKYALKEVDAAIEASKRALEINSNLYIPHIILAYIYWGQKKYPECEIELKQAITNSSTSVRPYLAMGLFLLHEKRWDESEETLRKAINLDPSDWETPLLLANVLFRKSNYIEAMRELKRSYSLHPSISVAFQSFTLLISKIQILFTILFIVLIFLSLRLSLVFSIPILVVISALLLFAAISYFQMKRISTGVSIIIFNILIIAASCLFHL